MEHTLNINDTQDDLINSSVEEIKSETSSMDGSTPRGGEFEMVDLKKSKKSDAKQFVMKEF